MGIWGLQIIAIDGSKIELPNRKHFLEKYGGTGRDASSPTALASIAYDVLNNHIIDAQFEPLSVGERNLAKRHIENIRCNNRLDLFYTMFVFDRGLCFLKPYILYRRQYTWVLPVPTALLSEMAGRNRVRLCKKQDRPDEFHMDQTINKKNNKHQAISTSDFISFSHVTLSKLSITYFV